MVVGKGIEALIRKKGAKAARESRAATGTVGVFFVDISKIIASASQPRKDFSKVGLAELAASIRQHGILQPLLVEKHEVETKRGLEIAYHILAGERRLRAARLVGLRQVPVVIRQAQDDRTRLLISLIENVQREDLNAMERAEAFARLRDDFELTQEEIAQRIGKARETIANALRLLQLDPDAREAIRRGEISEGHARALLAVPEKKRIAFLRQLKAQPMSVREAEALVRDLGGTTRQAPVRAADPRRARDEEKLRERFGVPVRITTRGARGSVAFVFHNKEELQQVLKRLFGR